MSPRLLPCNRLFSNCLEPQPSLPHLFSRLNFLLDKGLRDLGDALLAHRRECSASIRHLLDESHTLKLLHDVSDHLAGRQHVVLRLVTSVLLAAVEVAEVENAFARTCGQPTEKASSTNEHPVGVGGSLLLKMASLDNVMPLRKAKLATLLQVSRVGSHKRLGWHVLDAMDEGGIASLLELKRMMLHLSNETYHDSFGWLRRRKSSFSEDRTAYQVKADLLRHGVRWA